MAIEKPKGWLDKYASNVAASDATRTSPALNYRSVEDSARIEREKELARRKTSIGPQSKPSVAMKQAAEERYAQQKRNEKYKKAAEYAQVIGGGLEVAAPFTGPLAPIIGGAGTLASAGSSAYLAGRDVAEENYGSALMNAGFGGLGIAGYTPAARAANVGGVNVAKAANTADYVSDVASTYNAYDDYGSNYAQRIQNIRQHVTEDELRDITRPRRRSTSYNDELRSHPDDGLSEPPQPSYLDWLNAQSDPFDVDQLRSAEPSDFMDKMINRAIDKSSNVDYNLGASVMGMPIPNRLAGNTLRDWSNYNELSTTGGANFLQQWQEQNGSLIKQTLLGKLKDKAGKVINTVDEKLGKLVSPPRSLPEGVTLEKLSDEINKELTKGVGVKKVDFPLRINLAGKGNLDELYANTQIINPATNQLVNAGNITLARQQQPYGSKKFSEVLFPNKKPSTNPGRDTWNNTLGFAKTADFPFTKLSEQDKAILEKQGVSGEFNKAINEVLKRNNLGNILSGGTGHTQQGADRWENLIQKGLAEDLGGRFYKLKKNGGWLEKYNDGGPIQPNYNDASVTLSDNFVGEGTFNGPNFKNPAWGGQFQDGGKVITSRKDFSPGILSNIPGLSSLASGNQPGYNRHEKYGPLGDLYRYYGGLPLEHDVLIESQSKPAKSKDKNAKYISLNRDQSFVNEVLDNYKRVSSGKLDKGESKLGDDNWQVSGYSSAGKDAHKTIKQGSEHHSNAIGRYTLGKGKDEKGEYISYYDKFDQGTGSEINPGELLGLTKPFEIYDRIYVDPKTGKPKMAMGGSIGGATQGIPGATGFMYARTGSIPSNGKYAKKTKASAQDGKYLPKGVPGENEPLQFDPEDDAPFMMFGKPYEEPDRSREFPSFVPAMPAEELRPIDININQRNLLAEHTFTHQPGMKYDENLEGAASDNYMLKRTVTPYVKDEDIRLNTQVPTNPRDINFISNYKGAIGEVDQYPTSVPYQGEKHWNIDRFVIDPQFSTGYSALENFDEDTDKTQQRRNTLADMYKYFMLQNKGDRDTSWKQANEFMTKEIDPRISGPVYNTLRGDETLSRLTKSITGMIDEDYLTNFNSLKNEANLPDSDRSEVGRDFLKNPASDKQAKDLAMDWLVNYKKMSSKQAEQYYNKLPKTNEEYYKNLIKKEGKSKNNKRTITVLDSKEMQNGGEMKFYQEGLDFKPKSISKNGSVIKDDRGQWAHPGEITEIGSNQITMQGVPYPVLGISDTGDMQMMYPNQEYQYDGNSVTEYPMMQDGGVIDSIVSAGKGVVNYFDNLIKTGIDKLSSYDDPKPTTSHTYKKQPDFSNTPDVFDEIIRSGQYGGEAWTNFDKKSKSNDKTDYTSDKNRIKLNTGRFKGANVSSKLIDDLAAAAKRNNIPVGQLLTLAGRESTFGEDQSIRTNLGDMRGQRGYTSAWDVAQDYQPYDANRFLADNKVPGIEVIKNSAGWGYDIVDVNATKEYVNSHPELLKKYKDKLAKTPSLGNKNYFDLSAEFLKKKGVKGYNPGDPNYEKMFNQDYDTLKQDKALMSYLKKKGYTYEQGGQLTKLDQLTNFTNYNTKQPGGWLDKYQ